MRTDFLAPRTSFLDGVGSALSIGGSYFGYSFSDTEEEADSRAIRMDWLMIGQDVYRALGKFSRKYIGANSQQ